MNETNSELTASGPLSRRRLGVSSAAMILAATGRLFAAGGLGAFDPGQAVVFDGSTAAEDIFAVALAEAGYFLDLGEPGFDCPETDHASPGGLVPLLPEMGVFPLGLEIGKTLLFEVPSAPSTLPIDFQSLETDCDLLSTLPALESHLSSVCAQAQNLLAETQACRDRVRDLYCQVVAAIEEATTLPPDSSISANVDDGLTVDSAPPGPGDLHFDLCVRGLTNLAQIPGVLDYLIPRVAACEDREAALAALQAKVAEIVQFLGGIAENKKQALLAQADALLGSAEAQVAPAEGAVALLDSLKASLGEESLEASCAECGPSDGGGSQLALSGAVRIVAKRNPIGRFVGAFESAANHTEDAELAAHLADLAERLDATPDDRVLQVIFPSASAVGQHLVAVRPPDLPDDGSPLVVVLSGLAEGAPLPAMNAADVQFLFEQVRVFRATLQRGRDDGDEPR
jgi:hypothetical protein